MVEVFVMLPVVLTSGIFIIVFLQTKPRIGNFLLDSNVSLSSDILLPGSPKVYIPEVSFDVVLYPDHTQCMEVMKQQCLQILLHQGQKYMYIPSDERKEDLNVISPNQMLSHFIMRKITKQQPTCLD